MRFESMDKSQSADEYLRIFDKLFFDLLSGFSYKDLSQSDCYGTCGFQNWFS